MTAFGGRLRLLVAGTAIIGAMASVVLGCGSRGAGKPTHARIDVTIRQIAFQLPVVTASAGDTIVWSNHDLVPHTVTARDHSWDSGNLPPDSTWRLVVPARDSLPYVCRFHGNMHGTIVVRR
jgi:plastocyanin